MASIRDETTERRPVVGVIGDGTLPEESPKRQIAETLGGRLVEEGHRIACGGLGGVMECVCRGARRSEHHFDGATIGVLPGGEHSAANRHVDIVVPTGMGHTRNALVAHSDAVVAIGGGAGTLSEMAFGWILDRLVIAYRTEGWSGKLAGESIDPRDRFPELDDDRVFGVENAEEVVACLSDRLAAYGAFSDSGG